MLVYKYISTTVIHKTDAGICRWFSCIVALPFITIVPVGFCCVIFNNFYCAISVPIPNYKRLDAAVIPISVIGCYIAVVWNAICVITTFFKFLRKSFLNNSMPCSARWNGHFRKLAFVNRVKRRSSKQVTPSYCRCTGKRSPSKYRTLITNVFADNHKRLSGKEVCNAFSLFLETTAPAHKNWSVFAKQFCKVFYIVYRNTGYL